MNFEPSVIIWRHTSVASGERSSVVSGERSSVAIQLEGVEKGGVESGVAIRLKVDDSKTEDIVNRVKKKWSNWLCYFSTNSNIKLGDNLQSLLDNKKLIAKEKHYKKVRTSRESIFLSSENSDKKVNVVLRKIGKGKILEVHTPQLSLTNLAINTSRSIKQIKISDLIAAINHRLISPLENIIKAVQLLKPPKGSEQKDFIGILKRSCSQMMSISNDIKDLMDLWEGKIILKPQKVSLKDLLEFCTQVVRDFLVDKDLTVNINVSSDLPTEVYVDDTRLKQIIVNILTNAIDNTEQGGVSISVTPYTNGVAEKVMNSVGLKQTILFKIKDTGRGISSKTKKRVDYILGLNDDDSNDDGNEFDVRFGFGLLIAKGLCEMMKGKIWYKTEEDMGSVFYFTITI